MSIDNSSPAPLLPISPTTPPPKSGALPVSHDVPQGVIKYESFVVCLRM